MVDVTGVSEVYENTCVHCGTPDSAISSGTVWKSQISYLENENRATMLAGGCPNGNGSNAPPCGDL